MAQQIESVRERFQVEAVPQLATGKPYLEIPRLATERQADLMVIGAHGEHFFYDLFIGSTVEKVLQNMMRPLLVEQRPLAPYRHILVPLDFSPVSDVALAVTAAYCPEVTVSVLHAYELFFERKLITAAIANSALTEYRQQAEAEALRRLTHLVDAHLPSRTRVALYAKQGYPATVIRTMAEDLEPDLILIGKNEHSVLVLHHAGSDG